MNEHAVLAEAAIVATALEAYVNEQPITADNLDEITEARDRLRQAMQAVAHAWIRKGLVALASEACQAGLMEAVRGVLVYDQFNPAGPMTATELLGILAGDKFREMQDLDKRGAMVNSILEEIRRFAAESKPKPRPKLTLLN